MFLFAWMGSLMFWVAYVAITLFVGTAILRHIAPKTYAFVTTGEKDEWGITSAGEFIMLALLIYLFWHFLAICLIIKFCFSILFRRIIGPTLRRAILFSDSVIPNIEIKRKENN